MKPMEKLDAFIVHATTGLPPSTDRNRYIREIDEIWNTIGL